MSVKKNTKTATKSRKTVTKSRKTVTKSGVVSKKIALKQDGTLKKGFRYLKNVGIVRAKSK